MIVRDVKTGVEVSAPDADAAIEILYGHRAHLSGTTVLRPSYTGWQVRAHVTIEEAPLMKITTAQLAALQAIHQHGAIDGSARRRIFYALEDAGLARFFGPGYWARPGLKPWADGFGAWHVIVPEGIDNPRAVARAVIRGELLNRAAPGATFRRLRVKQEPYGTSVTGGAKRTAWREA